MQADEFRLGEWRVKPAAGLLVHADGSELRLQPKVMAVLEELVNAGGEIVSRRQLVERVWGGRATSDEPINRCIAELRAALGDDAARPAYIRTYPKRGYCLVAAAEKLDGNGSVDVPGRRFAGVVAGLLSVILSIAGFAALNTRSTGHFADAPVVLRYLAIDAREVDPLLAAHVATGVRDALAQSAYLSLQDVETIEGASETGLRLLVDHVDEASLRIQFFLELGSDRLAIPIRDIVFPESTWRSIPASDIGATLVRRLEFILAADKPILSKMIFRLSTQDAGILLAARASLSGRQHVQAGEMVSRLQDLVARYPDFGHLKALLAKAFADGAYLQSDSDWKERSETALKDAQVHAPDDAFTLVAEAQMLEMNAVPGTIVHQLRLLRRAAERAPSWSAPRLYLANQLMHHGYISQSRVHLELANDIAPLDPSMPYGFLHLAHSGFTDIQADDAYQSWRKLQPDIPGFAEIIHAYSTADSRLMKDHLERWWQPRFREVDFGTIVDGLFDEQLRSRGLEALEQFKLVTLEKRPALLLFSLLIAYGELEDARNLFAREAARARPIPMYLLWTPMGTTMRQSGYLQDLFDSIPAFAELAEEYGQNDFCTNDRGYWQCR